VTVHRDKFLVNKTNRRAEFQFYWYYDSCFRQSFCPSSGVLSRTLALVHFMQFDGRVLPGQDGTAANGHQTALNVPMPMYG
jgi:hypothetical protein